MAYNQENILKQIAKLLDRNNIHYMLTGAWSVIYYARPRASHDIDFVVELYEKDIPRLTNVFKSFDTEFAFDPESAIKSVHQKSMFNVVYLPIMLKIDFWLLKEDSFDQIRFKRRKKVKLLNQIITLSSIEDTILKKLLWYKEAQIEKHLIDAAFVYQIQLKNIDTIYLSDWAQKLGIENFLKELPTINLEPYL